MCNLRKYTYYRQSRRLHRYRGSSHFSLFPWPLVCFYQSLQVAVSLKCGFGSFAGGNNNLLLRHSSHLLTQYNPAETMVTTICPAGLSWNLRRFHHQLWLRGRSFVLTSVSSPWRYPYPEPHCGQHRKSLFAKDTLSPYGNRVRWESSR